MLARVDARVGTLVDSQVAASLAAYAAEQQANQERRAATADPQVVAMQQHLAELSRWAQRIDGLLNDHSGLVAAQSAHSALAQLATQAAGLGQHLDALTRRAEMTLHGLAGAMSQLPSGVAAGFSGGVTGGLPFGEAKGGMPPTFTPEPPTHRDNQRDIQRDTER
jgi:hypothetical protein